MFEVDLDAGELRRQGLKIKLHDKAFQLLLALLERPGELVTRQDLQHRLWRADTFVEFDNNLNNAMSRLRDALGDAADNPRFVETVPRRGYRFIAPVVVQPPPDRVAETPVETPPTGPRADISASRTGRYPLPTRGVLVVSLLVAVFGALAWRTTSPGPAKAPQVRSIAVLPFLNLSGQREQEHLADGLTEALIMELSRFRALRVTSRTSSMHYKAAGRPAPEVAAELKVDALVEGSIVREGDRLRVTVQLIDGPTDGHLWSSTYDRELGSVLALQREVASAIASEIRVTLAPEARVATAAGQLDADLSEVYLRGRYLLHRRNAPELQQALALFEQVIEREPDYAPAHAAVAAVWEALSTWANYVRPIDGFPRVKAAAARALVLDGSLAEAQTRLASTAETIDLDLSAAEQGYRRALELDPNSAEAHDRYARVLARTGRRDQALEMAMRAQQLDPFDFETNVEYAMRLADLGRHDEAIRHMRQTIDLDPTYYDPWVHLAYLYEAVGRTEDQVAAALEAVELSQRAPHAVHVLARTYARTGRLAEARALADELNRDTGGRNALELGRLHLMLGQPGRGLFWLQQACVERSVGMAYFQMSHAEPLFDPIRRDPRFQQVLQCAGVKTTPQVESPQ